MTSEYSIPVREIPIATLGQAKIPSPLPYGNMINTGKVMLSLSHEYDEDIDTHQTLLFEEAGPRQELYFDPGKTKCAIVTCGGLCPGLNDVIRAIVLEAYHAYNTPSVLGIRYGLEGFIPSYSHNVMELTPASVEHIYQFGGTLLGSSRGPQAPSEIVDALERLNVSVLFVIGGDGSMKAASAIAKEVRQRNIRISIIGIPKTIDNDINFVPQSFGFDTAVDKATEAIGCAHVEAVGTPNGIGIVKLMGRESGFIAAQSALALREANFVLIPEAPFQLHGDGGLLPALERRLKLRGHAVIIAAEGAGQHLLQQNEARDASGNPVLSDVGSLAEDVHRRLFPRENAHQHQIHRPKLHHPFRPGQRQRPGLLRFSRSARRPCRHGGQDRNGRCQDYGPLRPYPAGPRHQKTPQARHPFGAVACRARIDGTGRIDRYVARRRKSVIFRVLHVLTRSTAQADPRFGGFGQDL